MSEDGGVKSPEATVLSEGERKSAGQAQNAFEAGSYGECLSHLTKLRELRPADHKVLHNIAVAKYYHSGLTQTGDFVQTLSDLIGQLDAANGGDSEVEKRVLLFNLATVHFQLQNFALATSIAERLLPRVEHFSDAFSRSVYFLLCDLYISTSEAHKASSLLAKIDHFLSVQNNGQVSSSSIPGKGGDKGRHSERSSNPLGETEVCRLCQVKVRVCLMKQQAKKVCKREMGNMMATSHGSSVSALLLKSHFEFIKAKFPKAAKVLSDWPHVKGNGSEEFSLRKANASALGVSTDFHDDLFYNDMGCVYSRMHSHHLAAFFCQKALQLNVEQLSKAAAEHGSSCLATLDLYHRHPHLLYNAGVELLFAGQPSAAFSCLLDAVKVFHSNPLLWLRLAEACIGVFYKETEAQYPQPSLIRSSVGSGVHHKLVVTPSDRHTGQSSEPASMPAATLDFADMCLKNSLLLLRNATVGSSHSQADTHAPGRSAAGLFAQDALSNGVDAGSNGLGSEEQRGNQSLPPAGSGSSLSPLQSGHATAALRASVLLCGAYVSLCLGNSVVAVQHARELLSMPSISGSLRCHGSMYAAEALVELNRIDEAIAVLSPDALGDGSSFCNGSNHVLSGGSLAAHTLHRTAGKSSSVHFDHLTPASLEAGKASLYINLASVHSLNGDVERAKRCLRQACTYLPTRDLPPQTIQLAVFLELQSGNAPAALQILKRHHLPMLPKQAEPTKGSSKRGRKG